MYVPIHVYSEYSLGTGTASAADLAQRAKEFGLECMALTDVENLAAQVRYHHECKSRGIKAISGVELRSGFLLDNSLGSESGRVVLLARNRKGYELLCQIVSSRRSGTKPDETLPAVRILEFKQDLQDNAFVLTEDPSVAQLLLDNQLKPDCLKLLIVRPYTGSQNDELISLSKSTGIKLLADPHVVMLKPEDRPLHLLQMAIRMQLTVDKIRPLAYTSDRHLLSSEKVDALYCDLKPAIDETNTIADQCSLDLTDFKIIFPKVDITSLSSAAHVQNKTQPAELPATNKERKRSNTRLLPGELSDADRIAEQDFLNQACWQGLIKRGCDADIRYKERLQSELEVIAEHGFAPYFLVVAEIVNHAFEMGLDVAARGSGVSSLVTYVLGITNIDPVKNGLYFERFLHQHRMELPDIDLDFDSNRRDEIIEWVFKRFGREHVAMVSAYMTFQRRSALREGLKALGMPLREIEEFCKTVPLEELNKEEQELLTKRNMDDPFEIPVENLSEPYRSFLPWILRLIGKPHHISIHPGGVVIADREIARCAPIERAPKGIKITQYDMRAAELAGLVKIDLLGNRCLSELQETLELVKASSSKIVPQTNFSEDRMKDMALRASLKSIRDIPLDDADTLKLIGNARTIGCFQIETPVMRSVLSRMPVRGVHDVVAALAIARPGPAAGRAKATFLKRARGEDRAKVINPLVESCLADTYGLPLYDEQIMLMISSATGWTLAEADSMRERIIHAQLDPPAQEKLRLEFAAAAQKYGATATGAEDIWSIVDNFAAYSFNKAHACSYALLAYQSAFLKAHVPAEFACAVLNNHGGLYPLRSLASDFQRAGVRILPPSVNHSFSRCSMDGSSVRVGLDQIKYLTQAAKRKIITVREKSGPFKTLEEFLQTVHLSAREIEALIMAGVCDNLHPLSPDLYPFAHEGAIKALGKPADPSRLQTFMPGGVIVESNEQLRQLDRYRSLVRVSNELKFFHMHLSDHPLRILRSEADKHMCIPISQLESHIGEQVKIAGMIAASRRVLTRSGLVVHYLSFEDEFGIIESVLSPAVYRNLDELIQNPGPYLVEGKIELDGGELKLNIQKLAPFHKRDKQ